MLGYCVKVLMVCSTPCVRVYLLVYHRFSKTDIFSRSFYRPRTQYDERFMFSQVCVCSGEGGYTSQDQDRVPPPCPTPSLPCPHSIPVARTRAGYPCSAAAPSPQPGPGQSTPLCPIPPGQDQYREPCPTPACP